MEAVALVHGCEMDTASMDQVQIAVIVPTYNCAHLIGEQLEALANQAWEGTWETIIVDNGSTDNTPVVVGRFASRLPGLRLIDGSARKGPAFARNLGVQVAQSEFVVFVDADDVVAPGFLSGMAEALQQQDFVASRLDTCTPLNQHWLSARGQHPQFHGPVRYHHPPYLYHASGCGLAMRRSHFLSLGGFDEERLTLEDTEFCFRAQRAGIALGFAPKAIISYRNRASLRGLWRQARSWGAAELGLVRSYHTPVGFAEASRLWLRYFARWLRLTFRLLLIRSRMDAVRLVKEFAQQVGIFDAALRSRQAPI